MNITPRWANDYEYVDDITSFIKKNTTVENFEKKCSEYKDYTLDMGDSENGDTALIIAALKGNLDLIVHIVNKCGQGILFVAGDDGHFPLHATPYAKGLKGLLAAKILIQYGTPIDIKCFECDEEKVENLLTCAIDEEHIGITVLCLKAKMECPDWYLKEDKKEKTERIINEAKKVIEVQKYQSIFFSLCMKELKLIPEITNLILSTKELV